MLIDLCIVLLGTTVMQELVWLVANDMNFDEAHRKYLIERFPYLEYSIIYNINPRARAYIYIYLK